MLPSGVNGRALAWMAHLMPKSVPGCMLPHAEMVASFSVGCPKSAACSVMQQRSGITSSVTTMLGQKLAALRLLYFAAAAAAVLQ